MPAPRGAPFPFDPERLRNLLRQLAEGLYTLHQAGKLHRDVKPSNVLVTKGDRVVILDFGLVVELSDVETNSGIAGTPAYMSPEQRSGSPLSESSDWYSVGVMLYEAITGELPPSLKSLGAAAGECACNFLRPSTLLSAIPKDLEDLCSGPDPARSTGTTFGSGGAPQAWGCA